MASSHEIKYPGNKRIDQDVFHICSNCQQKLSTIPSERVNKFRSQTCPGCSEILREAAEGKERPDFSSFIITVLEHMTSNTLITRITSQQDVQEKLGGSVKISKAVLERHDPIMAHVYSSEEYDMDKPESVLSSVDSNLLNAYNTIKSLDNFDADISVKSSEDGYTDVYVTFYHVRAGNRS